MTTALSDEHLIHRIKESNHEPGTIFFEKRPAKFRRGTIAEDRDRRPSGYGMMTAGAPEPPGWWARPRMSPCPAEG
jgi:hypothetical protein